MNVFLACNCHGHANECYYDPLVEEKKQSLNIDGDFRGGGVCVGCRHNTAGVNCETYVVWVCDFMIMKIFFFY